MPATPEATANTPASLPETVNRIAAILGDENFPTGERAALKRLVPGKPPGLAFYRFFYRHVEGHWTREARIPDWVTVLAGMALMCPRHHQRDRPAGKVLAENRYAEARLERLLAADPPTRRRLLLRAARFLAARGEAVDWADFARLLFARDDAALEDACRRIARDFYLNQPKE